MNKAVLLILTGTLALVTVGCSLFSGSNESGQESQENTVKPIPVQAQGSPETEPEEFADLEAEAEAEAEPTQEIAGLIPATNPEVRVRSSVRGRQDPFSVVSLNPRIEIEETESDDNPPNPNPNSNRDRNLPSPAATEPIPAPPPVNPTLAEDVVITGLYQANGITRLIVQAPEENTSRYVRVGEYLSNGQVLVKSIDTSQSPPLVILEQSGVEVAKAIGEDAEADGSDISFSPLGNPPNPYRLSSVLPE